MHELDEKVFLELARHRGEDRESFNRFVRAVIALQNQVDLHWARILLKTYSEAPDLGSQEEVNGTLSTAQPEIRILAILEELPRLVHESWPWAVDLLIHEARDFPDLLRELARRQSRAVRAAFRKVVTSDEFDRYYAKGGQPLL